MDSITINFVFKNLLSVRVLPHQQDTGGFFIALLKKQKALPWEKTKDSQNSDIPVDDDDKSNSNGVETKDADGGSNKGSKPPPKKKLRRMIGYREDPFIFMKEDDDVWPTIR